MLLHLIANLIGKEMGKDVRPAPRSPLPKAFANPRILLLSIYEDLKAILAIVALGLPLKKLIDLLAHPQHEQHLRIE